MQKLAAFPEAYVSRIDSLLRGLGTALTEARTLAAAVQRLSDFYLASPNGATPWHEPWARIAYACYYFPLNYLRVAGALAEARRLGFMNGLKTYCDFGSGVGTVSLAVDDLFPGHFSAGTAVERADAPMQLHRQLQGAGATPMTWTKTPPPRQAAAQLQVFSYSLTELAQLPAWALGGEALLLIEPATHQDGRRLLGWRRELLDAGWHVWAPCTHAGACPLLTASERDWCHDRIDWQAPAWFDALSAHLPMRQGSLAYAYLMLRRTPAPAALAGLERLTGDLRKEKGAARQLVCRGPQREFLSWQKKHGEPPGWPRGGLVRLPADLPAKGNERRLLPDDGALIDGLPD